MNQARDFEPLDRLRIVFEGMRNEVSVTDLCRDYGISTNTYYRWRRQVFRHAERFFRDDGKRETVSREVPSEGQPRGKAGGPGRPGSS